jgi:hypothetical protein
MGGHSDDETDSNSDSDNDQKDDDNNHHVGFDQLINEDSDDDIPIQTINTGKTNMGSSRFSTSRHKEQQYEHFQDSDDDDDDDNDETNSSTTKTSSSKYRKKTEFRKKNQKTIIFQFLLHQYFVENITWF